LSFSDLFRRRATPDLKVPGPANTTSDREDILASDDGFLDAMYWIVLGRALDQEWRKTRARHFELGQSRDAMLQAALASSEFRQRYHDVLDSNVTIPGEDVIEAALGRLGTSGAFIDACYVLLLNRPADADGRAYYASLIDEQQQPRLKIVYALLHSDEFADRYKKACPSGGHVPIDVQLCELANPAKWDNPEWRAVMHALRLPAEKKLAMHRKAYEFTQTAWGLDQLGALTEHAAVLSVGAGHESLAYWLANRVRLVIATDLYPGEWESSAGSEGDARVLKHPEEFAPFAYRQDHLRFLQMDGRRLAFRGNSFDVAYSLSSIEHFGGFVGAREAVEEMARVIRPGGLIALATEWRVSGPSGEKEGIFEPDEVRRLIDMPSLELVQPLDDRVWQRYQARPVDLRRNRYETPHMLLEIDGTVFTSVMMFLRKKS
jgi:SAM-dependent methyltransferase